MKKFSVLIVLLICSVNLCCVFRKTANNAAGTETKNTDTEIELIITEDGNEYVTLPNGVIADARITEDDIDMIFRRFEAIENGDIAAFRSTLGEMQDGVDFHYQLNLIYIFFGDFFDIAPDDFCDAVATGEGLTEIARTLFNGDYPLKRRNTGLIIKKLEIIDAGGLRVTAINNKNEELMFDFIYY